MALTQKGRALYDELLAEARRQLGVTPNEDNAAQYNQILTEIFTAFPDDYQTLHDEGLAYFYYQLTDSTLDSEDGQALLAGSLSTDDLNKLPNAKLTALINDEVLRIEPIVYEDFLPVSAAGIFQSNLQEAQPSQYDGYSSQQEFERDLGAAIYDEMALYEAMQAQSLEQCLSSVSI